MNVTVKVGSVIRIPLLAGMSVSSGDPSIITATMQGTTAVLTAVKVGQCPVVLKLATDLSVTLTINAAA